MPIDDALREYYSSYYESPIYGGSRENVAFDDPRRFAKHLTHTILKYQTDSNVSILDFGGGDGSISYAVALELLKKGVDLVKITIIDYDDKTVLSRDSRISINKLSSPEDTRSLYNIVIASAIIEHLPRPKEPLISLLNHLKNGGIFYARTPYVVPFAKLCGLIGVKWDFTYPAHVHDLGQDFWETYFKEKTSLGNFRILESKPSIVDSTLGKHFLRTITAYSLKAPWYLLGRKYKWVGGWEIFVRKNPVKDVGIKP
jgi:2-polyprenyl-3-methyl-5-hydroxy-6-metoxy-1,4-benzoquinol methylase